MTQFVPPATDSTQGVVQGDGTTFHVGTGGIGHCIGGTGATGPTGPAGPTGAAGAAGSAGATGPTGPTGPSTLPIAHDGVAAGSQPTLDFDDGSDVVFTVVDDGIGHQVHVGADISDSLKASIGGAGIKVIIASLHTQDKLLNLWNGSSNNAPPTGWQNLSFDDSAWAAPVAVDGSPSGASPIAGSELLWTGQTVEDLAQTCLTRHTFTLPAGVVTAIHLQIFLTLQASSVYVNETLVYSASSVTPPVGVIDVPVPATQLVAGGANVIAVEQSNAGFHGPGAVEQQWIDYLMTITLGGASAGAGAGLSVYDSGTLAGTEPGINLIPGSGVGITMADNPGAQRVDVTLTLSSGTGSAGPTGPTGPAGPNGATGPTGAAAPAGFAESTPLGGDVDLASGLWSSVIDVTPPAGTYEISATACVQTTTHAADVQIRLLAGAALLSAAQEDLQSGLTLSLTAPAIIVELDGATAIHLQAKASDVGVVIAAATPGDSLSPATVVTVLAPGSGPEGPTGPSGPTGPIGPTGPAGSGNTPNIVRVVKSAVDDNLTSSAANTTFPHLSASITIQAGSSILVRLAFDCTSQMSGTFNLWVNDGTTSHALRSCMMNSGGQTVGYYDELVIANPGAGTYTIQPQYQGNGGNVFFRTSSLPGESATLVVEELFALT